MPRKYLLWLIGIGSAIVVLLIALVVIVAADDGEDPVAGPSTEGTATTEAPPPTGGTTTTPTTPPTTATTMAPTTTATTVAATTTVTTSPPGPSCVDAGSRPGTRTAESTVTGDFDGDGLDDLFAAYQLNSSWFLWARLSDGNYRLVTEINMPWSFANWDGTTPENLAVLGAHRLGDPREVATVRLYAGLGQIYGLFAIENCQIVVFTDAAGMMPDLYSAMGPSHTEFPVCVEPDPIAQQAELSCPGGSDMASCVAIDATMTSYDLSRDPARIVPAAGGPVTMQIDQTQYGNLIARSCTG